MDPWLQQFEDDKSTPRIILEYARKEKELLPLNLDEKSFLPLSVQKFVLGIFDIRVILRAVLEMEIDLDKTPLCNLSVEQVNAGFEVMTELKYYTRCGSLVDYKWITDASVKFLKILPHNFGSSRPATYDREKDINALVLNLDDLMGIITTYNLLKPDASYSCIPVEQQYFKLKSEITPVDRKSKEYKMILEFFLTNRELSEIGTSYDFPCTIDALEIFRVSREGEAARFRRFENHRKRRLLFYGTKVTNYPKVFTQGLLTASPEAPPTCYRFGKGIYFKDLLPEEYYTHDDPNSPGVLLICEVALGTMRECVEPEPAIKLRAFEQSVFLTGRIHPNIMQHKTLSCGAVLPLGKPIDTYKVNPTMYNEYVVYNEDRVIIRYMIHLTYNRDD